MQRNPTINAQRIDTMQQRVRKCSSIVGSVSKILEENGTQIDSGREPIINPYMEGGLIEALSLVCDVLEEAADIIAIDVAPAMPEVQS